MLLRLFTMRVFETFYKSNCTIAQRRRAVFNTFNFTVKNGLLTSAGSGVREWSIVGNDERRYFAK